MFSSRYSKEDKFGGYNELLLFGSVVSKSVDTTDASYVVPSIKSYVKLNVLLCVFGIVLNGLFSTEISVVLFEVVNTVCDCVTR